ncbi:MAG: MarR family transcriptional regulator [Verrucomicrobiota bacterium]
MTKRRLPPLLRRAWFSLNQAFRQHLAPLGITPDQFTILRWLVEADAHGLTQVEITVCMASDPNTITATVRRMESAGLLERVPHETDGRSKRVRALPRGREVFEEGASLALDLQGRVLGCLSTEEAATFLELLERVSEACAQAGPAGTKRSLGS